MQRSRKALLTRRALWKTNKNNFYKWSLPLLVFMWGLLFLPHIQIGNDDGSYRGKFYATFFTQYIKWGYELIDKVVLLFDLM